MKFQEGTPVTTVGGDKVGTIDRLVVDPITNDVTHIIVQKGFLFTEDRVIPVEAIAQSDEESLQLTASVEGLDEFPKFEERYFVTPQGYESQPYKDWAMSPVFYYPPVGPAQYPYYDGAFPNGVVRKDDSIPEDNIVMSEGAKVITMDDEHAGEIEKVITDEAGKITHLLISKGLIFTTERLIPIGWVRQLQNDEIKLYVRNEVIEDLPEFED